jgi:hypothetical protein
MIADCDRPRQVFRGKAIGYSKNGPQMTLVWLIFAEQKRLISEIR